MTQTVAAHTGGRLELERRPWLLLSLVTLLYFTQGIPGALFYVVIPTWLTVSGYSLADVATVVGAAALPATVKFLGGLLVDRFPYLPMGRRKPWIMIGQALLCASLIAGAIFSGTQPTILFLSALAIAAQAGVAIQDVSVDSLVIDMMTEKERARSGGFTYGASNLGMGSMIFVGGRLIEDFGLGAVFAILAILPVIGGLVLLPLRERAGERLYPWSKGEMHPVNGDRSAPSWRVMFRELGGLFFSWLPILIVVLCAARYIQSGLGEALYPTLATELAGWPLTRYTDLQSMTLLLGGVVGVAFGGALLPRAGIRIANIALLSMLAVSYGAMALFPHLRADDLVLTIFLYLDALLTVCLVIAMFPLCMRVCTPGAAATQYALFMASFNLGRPIGAALVGSLGVEGADLLFGIIAALSIAGALVFVFVRMDPPVRREET